MSKQRSPRTQRSGANRSAKSKMIIAAVLILGCVVGTAMLAQVTPLKKGKNASGDVSTMSLSAGSPAKEYIYVGSKLIATVDPTAVNGNDAQFVSMCVREDFSNPPSCVPIGTGSPFGNPGQTYIVTVIMQNKGTTTWTSQAGYKLGSQNAANNSTWGLTRASLTQSVAPGGQAVFTLGATKPSPGSGYLNFQWQMVQDGGVGFFGEKTANRLVSGGAWLPQGTAADFATFVSQEVPTEVESGGEYLVTITMHNAGTTIWSIGGGANPSYKLGSQIQQDNTNWGLNRVSLEQAVNPGEEATFKFTITAPATDGVYNFQWMMVKEVPGSQPQWFGLLTPTTLITVQK